MYPKSEIIDDNPVTPQNVTPNIFSELRKLPCKWIKIYCLILTLSAVRDAHILLNGTFTDKRVNAGPMQVHAWAFENEK